MEFAKLNHRITLMRHCTHKDEIGNHITKWCEDMKMWASVDVSDLTSFSEETKAGVTKEVRMLKFTVRQCEKLLHINSTTHRICFHKQLCNIISVKPDYKDSRYMLISCEIREAGAVP